MSEIKIAEAFHPAEYIREEMETRGWDINDLAAHMTVYDLKVNRLAIELFMDCGPGDPDLLMDEDSARKIGFAFGTGHELWLNLFNTWREWKKAKQAEAIAAARTETGMKEVIPPIADL